MYRWHLADRPRPEQLKNITQMAYARYRCGAPNAVHRPPPLLLVAGFPCHPPLPSPDSIGL